MTKADGTGPITKLNVAAVDPVTGLAIDAWQANPIDGAVYAVTAAGSKVWLGGDFVYGAAQAAGQRRGRRERDRRRDDPRLPIVDVTKTVRSIAISGDGTLAYLGGTFDELVVGANVTEPPQPRRGEHQQREPDRLLCPSRTRA